MHPHSLFLCICVLVCVCACVCMSVPTCAVFVIKLDQSIVVGRIPRSKQDLDQLQFEQVLNTSLCCVRACGALCCDSRVSSTPPHHHHHDDSHTVCSRTRDIHTDAAVPQGVGAVVTLNQDWELWLTQSPVMSLHTRTPPITYVCMHMRTSYQNQAPQPSTPLYVQIFCCCFNVRDGILGLKYL